MARKSRFDIAFDDLKHEFRALTKRRFLTDIKGQIEEDEKIDGIVRKYRTEPKYLAVSFDRRKNDRAFSYSYFDLILVALDAVSGGSGIYKPVNQLRVLRWNGTTSDLLRVIRYLAKLNPQIRARRLLILPYPSTVVGQRIDRRIYKR